MRPIHVTNVINIRSDIDRSMLSLNKQILWKFVDVSRRTTQSNNKAGNPIHHEDALVVHVNLDE